VTIDHKYHTFADTPGSTHNLVVDLVPSKSRVLEFGCATGYMSEVLVSRLGCSVVGIEQSSSAAEVARRHCEKVVVGDAESLDLCAALGEDRFDVILFADVLEHLRGPAALLSRVRPFLAEGGSIVASIPNIAHGSVRLALLRGEFRYRELGLLDNTHIHFFTRESIQDTFEASGYLITQWVRQRLPIDQTEIEVPNDDALGAARRVLEDDHEATTYQFVIRAMPMTVELRQATAMFSAQLAAEREAVEQQGRVIAQREAELSLMNQRFSEQSRVLGTTTAALAEIRGSTAWRVGQRLAAARRFLAPRNSLRERVFLRLRTLWSEP
jgi:2-polyprenyl-3-methyl-5-hydroxy-6-metoxy-1,4-benzoquinol methylase